MADKNEGKNNFFVIFAVSLALLITNLDISIVNIALPTLSTAYNADTDAVSRVILFYVLGMAGFLPIFGKISDIRGSEVVFKWGYLVFTVFSALCGLAPGLVWLTVFRFFQGVGSAMLLSNFAAIIIKYLPVEFRGRAFGLSTIFGGIGVALGAPLGGLLIRYLDWRWIFFINIPVGILALFLNKKALTQKHTRDDKKRSFDAWGAFYSIASLMIMVYLLNSADKIDWLSPGILTVVGAFFLLLFLFVREEHTAPDPLLDLNYIRQKHLVFSLAGAFLFILIFDGLFFVFPFFFEFVSGFTTEKTGLIIMVCSLTSLIFSPLSGYIADKYAPTLATRIALVLFILSNILFVNLKADSGMHYILFSFFLLGFSMAMFFAANSVIIMSYAEKGKQGMLSALSSINTYIGTIIGVGVFQIIFSHGYKISEINSMNKNIYIDKIAHGYTRSIFLAIVLSIIALATAFAARERKIVTKEK